MSLIRVKVAQVAGLPKDFYTVPSGKVLRPSHIACRMVASATVGNRRAVFSALEGGDTLMIIPAGLFQTAGQTITYIFAPGVVNLTGAAANAITIPAPPTWYPAGTVLRFSDSGNVDAAGDAAECIILGELFDLEMFSSRIPNL